MPTLSCACWLVAANYLARAPCKAQPLCKQGQTDSKRRARKPMHSSLLEHWLLEWLSGRMTELFSNINYHCNVRYWVEIDSCQLPIASRVRLKQIVDCRCRLMVSNPCTHRTGHCRATILLGYDLIHMIIRGLDLILIDVRHRCIVQYSHFWLVCLSMLCCFFPKLFSLSHLAATPASC